MEEKALKKKLNSLIQELNQKIAFMDAEKNKDDECYVIVKEWRQSILDIMSICIERNRF